MSVLERDQAAAGPPPIRPRRDRDAARRRRLRRTIAIAVGALAVIALVIGVIVVPPIVNRATAVGRYDTALTEIGTLRASLDSALGAAGDGGPTASLAQLDTVLAVESPLIDAAARDELRAAVETATSSIIGDEAAVLSRPVLDTDTATIEQLDAEASTLEQALPSLRTAVASAPEKSADASAAIATAYATFTSGIRARGADLYNTWSDAEKSTEDAFFQSLDAALAASPEDLGAALQAAAAASDAMIASAQAYRDQIIAAAGSSSQPTGGDVDAQLAYLLQYWETYNLAEWGDYNPYGGDCVNFTSQGLIERGWVMDGTWSSPGAKGFASKAWISTTAMEAYLKSQGFVSNDNDHLDRVRVGDVGIFDWGERGGGVDHTMTVSKVEYTADGPVVYFVSHNADGDYRELQYTLFEQHSNSKVRIYSIP